MKTDGYRFTVKDALKVAGFLLGSLAAIKLATLFLWACYYAGIPM